MKKPILSTKDLAISFRTNQGYVRAVRGISFDLFKGETLAIVGESGSGKSVASRAIMGVLAGNGIIDGGSIIFENQDLTKITEDQFHKIRGNRIGLIFQDPMSSLNPIMKIGHQITEGMLVNGKRLKRRFNDLVIVEKSERIRLNQEKEALIVAYKAKIKALDAKKGEDVSQEKAALKAQLKAAFDKNKQDLAAAKKAFDAKKVEAKKIVQDEYLANKQKLQAQIDQLKQAFPSQSHEEQEKTRTQVLKLKEDMLRLVKVTKKEAYERAIDIMTEVGIAQPQKRFKQYPFQFSGGMRQRIVIAIALTANPEILICDEPTTALDVTIQAQILDLITKLKKERDLSVIFITHDLGVVARVADRVAVMYAGKIVEYGNVNDIFYNPKHPYTWALLSSMPDLNSKTRLASIPGTPPNMLFPPIGDAFAERNSYALEIDFKLEPPIFKVSEDHYAATWLLHPDAPKVDTPELIKERIKAMKSKTDERSK